MRYVQGGGDETQPTRPFTVSSYNYGVYAMTQFTSELTVNDWPLTKKKGSNNTISVHCRKCADLLD